MRALPLVLGLFTLAAGAEAQDRRLASADLPSDIQLRLTRLIDDPATRRFEGGGYVAPDQVIPASVVSFDGPLTVEGTITGEVLAIGGNVVFSPGAVVEGDVTVIDGDAVNIENARIGGTVTIYSEGFGLYRGGERVFAVNRRRSWPRERDGTRWAERGRGTLTLRTGINYNRVEGLPILFGPVIETGGPSSTRFEALGIVRTGAGDMFDSDQLGYALRLEQFLGTRSVRIGASARSVIEPIETWQVRNLEASLATFLLHDDQRDYYERQGWSVYARYEPRSLKLDATVGYHDEDNFSRHARDPWTLFGDGGWRAQPLVGEGRIRSLAASVRSDGRDDEEFPTRGWYVRADVARGLGGDLELASRTVVGGDASASAPAVALNSQFTSGLVDARVYRSAGRDGTLALRAAAGGSLDGHALPPQRQHALGGAGTMPGYGLLSADCGARNSLVLSHGNTFYSRYGCDRFVLGSIEYRGELSIDFGGDFFWDWQLDAEPNWMLFFDGGHGWALDQSRALGARNTGMLYDAGAGIVLGDFGIYGAVPLNGENRGLNLFVRLGARF